MTTTRTKSVKKRQRQQTANYKRNQERKSQMKSAVSKVLNSKSKDEAEILYRKAISIIDGLESKNIVHKNTAARRKSALTKYLNSLT